ncbi:uncharacterized protein CELE_Y2H9A.4 [Caenorhabditis elegans]|uniref:Transmembrane protein n=2 Tax=Caenorhabditis elegans TaxID=6239 RepID=H8ESD3_CAEEL|nr:Transmembrane protein [Caenorhabditis elegans]CCG28071.1 Transmembrane protein [Caenorhabditis elegans]|eukprot:NP_001256504.1 Uncharacterized protein CELE_Y2H9A.4 [Caenorhabditis elegans]
MVLLIIFPRKTIEKLKTLLELEIAKMSTLDSNTNFVSSLAQTILFTFPFFNLVRDDLPIEETQVIREYDLILNSPNNFEHHPLFFQFHSELLDSDSIGRSTYFNRLLLEERRLPFTNSIALLPMFSFIPYSIKHNLSRLPFLSNVTQYLSKIFRCCVIKPFVFSFLVVAGVLSFYLFLAMSCFGACRSGFIKFICLPITLFKLIFYNQKGYIPIPSSDPENPPDGISNGHTHNFSGSTDGKHHGLSPKHISSINYDIEKAENEKIKTNEKNVQIYPANSKFKTCSDEKLDKSRRRSLQIGEEKSETDENELKGVDQDNQLPNTSRFSLQNELDSLERTLQKNIKVDVGAQLLEKYSNELTNFVANITIPKQKEDIFRETEERDNPSKKSDSENEDNDNDFNEKLKQQQLKNEEELKKKRQEREERKRQAQEELKNLKSESRARLSAFMTCIRLTIRFEQKEEEWSDVLNSFRKPLIKAVQAHHDLVNEFQKSRKVNYEESDLQLEAKIFGEVLENAQYAMYEAYKKLAQITETHDDRIFLKIIMKSVSLAGQKCDEIGNMLLEVKNIPLDSKLQEDLTKILSQLDPHSIPTTSSIKSTSKTASTEDYENIKAVPYPDWFSNFGMS